MLRATAGQVLVNHALPESLRNYDRVLDRKNLTDLLTELANEHPEEYRETVQGLLHIGEQASTRQGGYSFGLEHLRSPVVAKKLRGELLQQLEKIHVDRSVPRAIRNAKIAELLGQHSEPFTKQVYQEALAEHNPLALQVMSGSRGKPTDLRSLLGFDVLYEDAKGEPVPIPILHSYSQGLTPAEYYAGAFGARKGLVDTKLGVARGGALSKMLIQANHRLVVSGLDEEHPPPEGEPRGLPVDVDDPDNEGALLAVAHGPHPRNTPLTPALMTRLQKAGYKKLLIRSPLTGGHFDGGLYARDLGIREKGRLPDPGEYWGITAAQSLAEKATQALLGSKHKGGVAGASKGVHGFSLIEQLVNVPSTFPGGATHARDDGKVHLIRRAPQGGHYVSIGNDDHYIPQGLEPTVKTGDTVEAGDVLSTGLPNPAEVVKHKGLGEGRRAFTYQFRQAFNDAGLSAHRRNVEVLAKGLVNHVKLHQELGPFVPDDVIPYHLLEGHYEPRDGHLTLPPKKALNHYLERPVLHYTIGTKVRPSVVKTLEDFGVKQVTAHPEPPPFEPVMVRALENITFDPDWQARFLGSYLERGLLHGVHRGDVSDEAGSSYVPSLIHAVDFGKIGPGKSLAKVQ
jgi:DNA-directed RNA polymerase subunit beta'